MKKLLPMMVLLWLMLGTTKASASCSVSTNTLYPTPFSSNTINLNISNTGSSPINWIRIPNDFTSSWMNVSAEIQNEGWEVGIGGGIIFRGGNLGIGESVTVSTTGNTGGEGERIYWGLSTSPNSDGSEAEACNTLELLITSTPPVPTPVPTPTPAQVPPTLSALSVTASATTAKVVWRSDPNANGVVNYGIGSEYGSKETGDNDVYDHSVTLTGLTANTTYHYSVSSTNINGTTTSSDNTFTTGVAGTSTTVTTTVTNTVTTTNTTTNTVNQTVILADTLKPSVLVLTKFAKAYAEPPIVEGKVVDTGAVNVGVVKIQYSTDGGENWLIIEEPTGASKVDFSFVPEVYEDGNYQIIVRATDKSGNMGVSTIQTLVIDRLPPKIIHALWRVGPIILSAPYQLVSGVPVQITIQAIGGVTEMNLRIGQEKYMMIKNFETGLWEGEIKTSLIGEYPVLIEARDGGGNEISQEIGQIIVTSNAECVMCTEASGITTTVYRLDEMTRRYKIWNGEVYGQVNPSKDVTSWYLPRGKYYIEAKDKGYQNAQTSIFDLNNSGVVSVNLKLMKWNLWRFWQVNNNLEYTLPVASTIQDEIKGRQVKWVDKSGYRGKEIRLVIMPIWEPRLSGIISNLSEDHVIIFPGANKSSVDLLRSRGSYSMEFVADPDGEILNDFVDVNLPIKTMINRRGQVESVEY